MAEQIRYLSKDNWLYIYQKLKLKFTSIQTALNNKVDKVEGKGLSTNDLTDALVAKINNAGDSSFSGDYDDLTGRPSINNVTLTGSKSLSDLGIQPAGTYATETYVTQSISNLVAAAPSTLDTLKELSDALGGDENFATTMTTELGKKVNTTDMVELTNAEIDTIMAD